VYFSRKIELNQGYIGGGKIELNQGYIGGFLGSIFGLKAR
jgi:hypothetical protein